MDALLFDFDGTIAETERLGHRVAYNAAFAQLGLDWTWDTKLYGELLAIGGGKERIAHYLDRYRNGGRVYGDRAALIAAIHETQTAALQRACSFDRDPARRTARRAGSACGGRASGNRDDSRARRRRCHPRRRTRSCAPLSISSRRVMSCRTKSRARYLRLRARCARAARRALRGPRGCRDRAARGPRGGDCYADNGQRVHPRRRFQRRRRRRQRPRRTSRTAPPARRRAATGGFRQPCLLAAAARDRSNSSPSVIDPDVAIPSRYRRYNTTSSLRPARATK